MTVRLTGKTWDHRETLKKMGGRWDGNKNSWVFDHLKSVDLEQLKKLPGCMVVSDGPKSVDHKDTAEGALDFIDRILRKQVQKDEPTKRTGKTVFYGDDREYFNHFKDKNPISFFGFSSLGKLTEFIKSIPVDKQADTAFATDSCSQRFTGSKSMLEAIALAEHGWQKGIEQSQEIANILTMDHFKQKRKTYSVAGGSVSVGRMLSGNPKHMSAKKKQPKNKTITLFVQNNGLANIAAEDMAVRAGIVCATCDILENSGYSCQIVSVTLNNSSADRVPMNCITVVLKHAGEKLNLNDTAFALGHPAFFRRFCFALTRQADELRRDWERQGRSTDAFNEDYQPGMNEFHIPHLKTNYRQTELIDKVREMWDDIKPEGLPMELVE